VPRTVVVISVTVEDVLVPEFIDSVNRFYEEHELPLSDVRIDRRPETPDDRLAWPDPRDLLGGSHV
jgi:hypothetical protein